MRGFGGLATMVLLECFWLNVLRYQGHSNTTDRLQSRDNSRERHQFASSYRSGVGSAGSVECSGLRSLMDPSARSAILRRAWLPAFQQSARLVVKPSARTAAG